MSSSTGGARDATRPKPEMSANVNASDWHTLNPCSEDDHECPRCGVIVADDALPTFSAPCPPAPCGDDSRHEPCVFVLGEHGSECAYCATPGHRNNDDDDEQNIDQLLAIVEDGLDIPDDDDDEWGATAA